MSDGYHAQHEGQMCAGCRFFQRHYYDDHAMRPPERRWGESGRCVRHPPLPDGSWPPVQSGAWCGDFAASYCVTAQTEPPHED